MFWLRWWCEICDYFLSVASVDDARMMWKIMMSSVRFFSKAQVRAQVRLCQNMCAALGWLRLSGYRKLSIKIQLMIATILDSRYSVDGDHQILIIKEGVPIVGSNNGRPKRIISGIIWWHSQSYDTHQTDERTEWTLVVVAEKIHNNCIMVDENPKSSNEENKDALEEDRIDPITELQDAIDG